MVIALLNLYFSRRGLGERNWVPCTQGNSEWRNPFSRVSFPSGPVTSGRRKLDAGILVHWDLSGNVPSLVLRASTSISLVLPSSPSYWIHCLSPKNSRWPSWKHSSVNPFIPSLSVNVAVHVFNDLVCCFSQTFFSCQKGLQSSQKNDPLWKVIFFVRSLCDKWHIYVPLFLSDTFCAFP